MIYRLLDGWMVFIIKDLIHSFFGCLYGLIFSWLSGLFFGRMDGFFFPPTAQGIWYDANGNSVPQNPPQVPGLHPSEFEPMTSEPPPGQNWNPSNIGSPQFVENERRKKEMYDRIQRDIADRKRRQAEYEKLKASVEARRAKEKAHVVPKAKVVPKTEAKPSGPKPKAMPPAGGPQVKAMPKRANAFHNLSYAVEHSSVEIQSLSSDEEAQQIAIPTPKAQQQYKTYEAAMKRMRRQ